jgi:hypothetical protein
MNAGRNGKGWEDGTDSPANDTSLDAAPGLADPPPGPSKMAASTLMTSPAFDRWLERQMKMLFAACEEPADEKLIKLIREAFPNDPAPNGPGLGGPDKVTK